jgi:glucosyl-dolichyl phosphate glucuronosyltransferase
MQAAGGLIGYTPHAPAIHFVPSERLTQEWFRRRCAWQAVSDFVHKPKAMATGAVQSWERLKGYLLSCPPADRTMRALLMPQESPDGLAYQLSAVYETMVVLLSGQAEADAD